MDINTFDDDLLGLEDFAKKLENFISIEKFFVPESLVISLDARFGSGKSTFLKMWRNRLAAIEEDGKKPLVISVNAWDDDYCGDPLVSLISALIDAFGENSQEAKPLKDAAKDVGWFLAGLGNQVVNKFTGIDVVAAGDLAEKKKAANHENQEIPTSFFDLYSSKRMALQALKTAIRAAVEKESDVLIMVDELDRCRPDYAISYLETIKHVFDVRGMTFVLAVDRRQLECSAKTAFGAGLDFPEYFRKFVQREVPLPQPKEKNYSRMASEYVGYYLERENQRSCRMKLDHFLTERVVELVTIMKMTPRQIQEMFRVMGHVLQGAEDQRGRLLSCLGIGTLLMSALRLGRPKIYTLLGNQELEVRAAASFFKEIGIDDPRWWFTLCYTGGGINVGEKQPMDVLRESGFLTKEEESQGAPDISGWNRGWGHSQKDRFKQIFYKIEDLSSWT